MALSKLPETLINSLEFLLDKKELHSWSSYEENGQVRLTIKFKDISSDVQHSTPSFSSFKRKSQKQLQRNLDRKNNWLQSRNGEVSKFEHSDFVSDISKSVNINHDQEDSGHFQETCISDLDCVDSPAMSQPSGDCITSEVQASVNKASVNNNNSPTCLSHSEQKSGGDSQNSDENMDCLSNMDKVVRNLAQWKYPKYPFRVMMPKDLKVSPQADPYCFYCESVIKASEKIAFCSSCIENYGNERHNIACVKCMHRIPEYCTCSPHHVTNGTYPDVDPYDVIIPIT